MEKKTAHDVLIRFNQFRRGFGNRLLDPFEISDAIDVAIAALERELFAEIAKGKPTTIGDLKKAFAAKCSGSGIEPESTNAADDGNDCSFCDGTGKAKKCPKCGGTGTYIETGAQRDGGNILRHCDCKAKKPVLLDYKDDPVNPGPDQLERIKSDATSAGSFAISQNFKTRS